MVVGGEGLGGPGEGCGLLVGKGGRDGGGMGRFLVGRDGEGPRRLGWRGCRGRGGGSRVRGVEGEGGRG